MSAFKKVGVRIGCRDVVFAKLQSDNSEGVTYDTEIMSAPGVVEIALTALVSSDNLGADDVALYEILNSVDGFDVSIVMASLGNDGRAFLLGNKIDDNGVLIESSDDIAPYVAMGFKSARSDGSDDYIWLYKGQFAQSDATFRTKEKGQVNWQTPTVKASFAPRINDKRIRAILHSADDASQTALKTFFDAPYAPVIAEAAAASEDGEAEE